MAVRILAWLTLGCSVVGGTVETFLIQRIVTYLVLIGDINLAYATGFVFIGAIAPIFLGVGIYAGHILKGLRLKGHESYMAD